MTVEQREVVERMARSSSLPHRRVVQARALLLAADGVATNEVARRCGTTDDSVRAWRRRFEVEGPDGIGRIARAVVLCFDEKTQVQALDRTQPSLPLTRGRAATLTHDYKRNGTTDLFAAMNVATGEVLYDCHRGHTAADVVRFFRLIDTHVPRPLEVHVVLDNLSAHKAPEVREWLAHPRRRRWHLHFTPTSSSWLNLIERWFKELTDRRLRHGVFTSVTALETAIGTWAEHWNDNPRPFTWHVPATDILAKVQRARAALTRTNSETDH